MVDEWMCVQHWWSDTVGEKLKYLETNLTQCYFDHHKPLTWNWTQYSKVEGQRLAVWTVAWLKQRCQYNLIQFRYPTCWSSSECHSSDCILSPTYMELFWLSFVSFNYLRPPTSFRIIQCVPCICNSAVEDVSWKAFVMLDAVTVESSLTSKPNIVAAKGLFSLCNCIFKRHVPCV